MHATVVEDDTKVEEKAVAAPSLTTRSVNRYETRELSINVFKTCLMRDASRHLAADHLFHCKKRVVGNDGNAKRLVRVSVCVKIEFDYGSCEDEDEWSQSHQEV